MVYLVQVWGEGPIHCLSKHKTEDEAWEEIARIDPEGKRVLGVVHYDPNRMSKD